MGRLTRLPRSFYRRGAKQVARALLGQLLVRVDGGRRFSGIIVETEAYLGIEDKAAHTFNGRRTDRNQSMWCDGGHAYVYFTYGMHHCFNVVSGHHGQPVAALVRALEPVERLDLMYARRGAARRDTDLCSGPAKLTEALGIDRDLDGVDLTSSGALFIERLRQRAFPSARVGVSPRVGVPYAGEWARAPLRFFLHDNPHVSRV